MGRRKIERQFGTCSSWYYVEVKIGNSDKSPFLTSISRSRRLSWAACRKGIGYAPFDNWCDMNDIRYSNLRNRGRVLFHCDFLEANGFWSRVWVVERALHSAYLTGLVGIQVVQLHGLRSRGGQLPIHGWYWVVRKISDDVRIRLWILAIVW